VYAHSLRATPEGVALVAVNTDRTASQVLSIRAESDRYTLSARTLLGATVELNGSPRELDANGALPPVTGALTPAGRISLPPASITFLAVPRVSSPRAA
jgi:heparanase 1